MSKAFTREDDGADEPILPRLPSPLPPGVKNYMTPAGARRMREELDRLVQVARPKLVAPGATNETRRELQALDQRIAYLHDSLHSAVVVDPPTSPDDQVRFGCTVTVRDKAGTESSYRLVGVDETDVDLGWVSWRSPIARALLNAKVGRRVRLKLPGGDEELEVIGVRYE